MKYKRKVVLPLIVLGCSIVLYLIQVTFMQTSTFFLLASLIYTILAWQFGREYDNLKVISEQDFLTKVYNRVSSQPIFQKLSNLAEKNVQKVAVLFLDINNFKMINDTYGHNVGDLLLQ